MVDKNDDVFREAIWEVYNKRCFYNKELIEHNYDLKIDHMLPESLTQEKLDEIIENYGLEPDYDLNSIYNLVLACSKCNSLKTNYIPERTTLLNNLTITKSKEPLVKEKMDEIRKNLSKLRLKTRLGAITRDEINERKIAMLKKEMNEYIEKLFEADGVVLGTPTYVANMTANMKALIERAVLVSGANGNLLKYKIGAAVVAVRRAGATNVFSSLNFFFLISEMIVVGSTYWNLGIGLAPGDVNKDREGIRTFKNLGKNFAFVLQKMNA